MSAAPRLVAGVDVGGTFTDVFCYDERSGACGVAKVPSTHDDQARGFLDGLRARIDDLATLGSVVHGTTVGTNALLQRQGARTGVITTRGFRDVLEMRRRDRPGTWGLWGEFEPIVPRDLRLEVDERTLADGTIDMPVDLDGVRAAARALRDADAEALSIIFINAYANAENERQALAAAREIWPNGHVNASHEILPEFREFERASTTAINAYLQPLISDYLGRLEGTLALHGFAGKVFIVQSNGGVMSVETARKLPVRTALSGPAAGVIAGAYIAEAAGFENVVTCDMGGTSFDVSLIAGGAGALAAQATIDFGLVVRTPMIEITTIGAGGGSIAWVDRGGLLRIGPRSAGSDPGPVAYGLGNDEPTVTDANVVTGRINAERPIGGKLARLDAEAARAAIEARIARPLGLDVMVAAEAIIKVANARMAGAIRLVSIERGHDPKKFAALPFGGAGALHTGALMRDVGLGRALIPRYPGITSALGCVVADMRHDVVRTLNLMLDGIDVAALDAEMMARKAEGEDLLARAGVSFLALEPVFEFDMAYAGQTHSVTVPIPVAIGPSGTGLDEAAIRSAFETRYRAVFGRLLDGIPIRLISLRAAVIGRRPKLDLAALAPAADATLEGARGGNRQVWIEGAWHEVPVYARLDLPVGAGIAGPAVLEQPDTTILIEPDMAGTVDGFGNLVLTRTAPS